MSDTNEPKKENRIARFFRETVGELRRVSWPSRKEATSLTLIVLAVMAVMGLFLGLVDFGATELLNLVLGL